MLDPASTKAVATVLIDNERVRVTEWRFASGAHTGHHRHEYPYVVVPMTTGPLAIRSAAGESTSNLVAGAPYYRDAGAEHDVINPNPGEFVFVELELKK
jgi:quercetin dioxygenase-like cupin family protein